MDRLNSYGLALALAVVMLLCACAWPHPTSISASPALTPATAPTPPNATPVVDSSESPLEAIDASCKVDADCEIKDIGSCCGYYPQCVNKDSPTFPEQVKARCASQDRMSVCGFPSISGCLCRQGQCTSSNAAGNGKEQ